jgi:hypothetical protein
MDRPLSTEEAFNLGAQAMQSQIAAFLMVRGHITLAPQVLGMEAPRFKLPETVVVSGQPTKEQGT